MSGYSEARLSAMRAQWTRNWAERQAAPTAEAITPEELARRYDEELRRRKMECMQEAERHRASRAAAAASSGEVMARIVDRVVAHFEEAAALIEAERQDRAARAKDQSRRLQPKAAASRPRPKRRPAVRDRIITMMAAEKATGTTFKTLLQRWEREPLDGLRLAETEPGRYTVEDENAEGVFGHYVTATLQKLYSPKK